jgi:hypothetical protein
MKKIVIVFACLLFGCTKEPVDVRDQYVGTYDMVGLAVYEQNGASVTKKVTEVLTVKKGSAANELFFSDDLAQNYSVTVSGNGFNIPSHLYSVSVNGGIYTFYFSGNGTLTNNNISVIQSATNGLLKTTITYDEKGTKR